MPKQKSKKPKKQPKGKKRAEPKQAAKSAKPAKQLKRADGKQAKQARRAEKKQTKEAKRAAGKQAKQGKKARALNGSTRQSKKPDRKDKTPAPPRQITQLPMAASNMRVGLLGGSFNPPHAAHIAISLAALKRLGLDRVWWLVTPGNPLKNGATLPSLAERVQGAKRLVAKHPGIEVTGFAGQKASSYTVDVLADLKRRAPTVKFVWLMGADNLADFHRWRSWEKIFRLMPMAVLDRPTFRLRARASKAAHRFSEFLVDESDASGLAQLTPPAWTIMSHKLSSLSSTALRATKPKSQKGKGKSKKTIKRPKNTSY